MTASLMTLLLRAAEILCVGGLMSVCAGAAATSRFLAARPPVARNRPPVTVLRPLCGDEPGLEAALVSICEQDYPAYQLVFGLQSGSDPALPILRRVQARFPDRDIDIVVDPTRHGPNPKISNLLNMMPAARHDILVCSDSDLHVPRVYLDRITASLDPPQTGLVTTVCTGLPTNDTLASRLGAASITHSFLPGVLISRALGRADCLGTTMALSRATLKQIGGFEALSDHVGDDNVLGQRVRGLGLGVALAAIVPKTSVPETTVRSLWQHELRWARTIRALEPFLFATSAIQYPLFWGAMSVLLSAGSSMSIALFAASWALRAAVARRIGRALDAHPAPFWLLPFRDCMSALVVAASYLGARVVWRGHVLTAGGYRIRSAGALPLDPAGGSAPDPAVI